MHPTAIVHPSTPAMRGRLALAAALAAAAVLLPQVRAAAGATPEIQRAVAKPQPVGQLHMLRQIPEACARIQGQFTGNPAEPYKFAIVKTSAGCAPRAELVDARKVGAATRPGWIYNDLVQVPSAACPTQLAVVRIWRKGSPGAPPKLDSQGRSRIYLEESLNKAKAGKLRAVPVYAAAMSVEGQACGK